jgi:hypothetical protein
MVPERWSRGYPFLHPGARSLPRRVESACHTYLIRFCFRWTLGEDGPWCVVPLGFCHGMMVSACVSFACRASLALVRVSSSVSLYLLFFGSQGAGHWRGLVQIGLELRLAWCEMRVEEGSGESLARLVWCQ